MKNKKILIKRFLNLKKIKSFIVFFIMVVIYSIIPVALIAVCHIGDNINKEIEHRSCNCLELINGNIFNFK